MNTAKNHGFLQIIEAFENPNKIKARKARKSKMGKFEEILEPPERICCRNEPQQAQFPLLGQSANTPPFVFVWVPLTPGGNSARDELPQGPLSTQLHPEGGADPIASRVFFSTLEET